MKSDIIKTALKQHGVDGLKSERECISVRVFAGLSNLLEDSFRTYSLIAATADIDAVMKERRATTWSQKCAATAIFNDL